MSDNGEETSYDVPQSGKTRVHGAALPLKARPKYQFIRKIIKVLSGLLVFACLGFLFCGIGLIVGNYLGVLVIPFGAASVSSEVRDREASRFKFNAISLYQRWVKKEPFDIQQKVAAYKEGYLHSYEGSRQLIESRYVADKLAAKDPVPTLDRSLDRFILAARATAFNNPSRTCYLYLILSDGTWIEVGVRGKLVSTTERLMPESDRISGPIPDERGLYGAATPSRVGVTEIGSLFEISGFVQYIFSEKRLEFVNLKKDLVRLEVQVTPEERTALLQRLEAAR